MVQVRWDLQSPDRRVTFYIGAPPLGTAYSFQDCMYQNYCACYVNIVLCTWFGSSIPVRFFSVNNNIIIDSRNVLSYELLLSADQQVSKIISIKALTMVWYSCI